MADTEKDLLRKVARIERALAALLAELARNAGTHASIRGLADRDGSVASMLRGTMPDAAPMNDADLQATVAAVRGRVARNEAERPFVRITVTVTNDEAAALCDAVERLTQERDAARAALDEFAHVAHAVLNGPSIVGVTDEQMAASRGRLRQLAGKHERTRQAS